jgi:hypothetical protein
MCIPFGSEKLPSKDYSDIITISATAHSMMASCSSFLQYFVTGDHSPHLDLQFPEIIHCAI